MLCRMQVAALSIPGSFVLTPTVHGDQRGSFLEWYRHDVLAEVAGRPLPLAQANCSVSRRGVVRGIHYADVPPGQAKYVTCPRGAVLDVVVDLRVGSPTFGRWEAVRLDDVTRRAVFLAEGLGHGFCALEDDTTVCYLCSTTYDPAAEHSLTPLDPELGITWPSEVTPILSARDEAAPTLAQALAAGTLPTVEQCRAHAERCRTDAPGAVRDRG
jgi:dTDP-4-dehydrorhamnose 3,5-epimerase